MLMKKIFLLTFVLLAMSLEAKVYNGIAMVVNGEPITMAEISAVQKQLGVSKQEATDMLVENRLQKSAMKDITVSEDEIDDRIKIVAKQNNLTLKKMQEVIKKQGQSWNEFRDQIKLSLQKQKFFRTKIVQTIQNPSDAELKMFYKSHAELFSMPASIKVVEYSASQAEKIHKLLDNPSAMQGVKKRNMTLQGSDITPQLLAMISQTGIGEFTPAFNNGSAYITYQIISKGKSKLKPFADVKNRVTLAWKRDQQADAIKRYFKKMKRDAVIETIRR